jgi:hypothetical protein
MLDAIQSTLLLNQTSEALTLSNDMINSNSNSNTSTTQPEEHGLSMIS